MAALRFPKDSCKAAATEAEALFNATGCGYSSAIPRHPKALAENPHCAGAVVNLKDAAPQRSKRAADPSGDGHFLAHKSPRITVNVGNACTRRAPGKQKARAYD